MRAVLVIAFVATFGAPSFSTASGPRDGLSPAAITVGSIGGETRRLPRLVFVSRQPDPSRSAAGFGPRGRDAVVGGRLMLREPSGHLHPLLPDGAFFDVSDPCVDWDARRILFAATRARDRPWRIWVVNADGTGLRGVTAADGDQDVATPARELGSRALYNDIDPCWLADGRICFASTRWPQRAQYADRPVTNLFVTTLDGTPPLRITSERNGAEEPHLDPRTGRVVYARWWFNRFLPSDREPGGITLERANAVPQDTINLWTAGSIAPDGEGVRLAGGDARTHPSLMAQQPIVLGDGSLVGVWAENPPLTPTAGRTGIQIFAGGFATVHGIGPAHRLAGPGTPLPGSACSPAELPDGRLLFSWAPEAAGVRGSTATTLGPGALPDFGIYVMKRDGSGVARVVDLPGTAELDVAVLGRRRRPPIVPIEFPQAPFTVMPPSRADEARDVSRNTFRFDCANVFANAPVDAAIPDAPVAQRGLRVRFFTVLARPWTDGGDSLILLRDAPVDPSGAIHVDDILADAPVFEQLVDAGGHILRTARGPTHVPGYNFARQGGGTKCMGCHTGHSAIPAPVNNWQAKWFNAAPSAEVLVSSVGAGTARGAVDRRTLGAPEDVAWVAAGPDRETLRLVWNQQTIAVRCVVLYGVRSARKEGTTLRVRETEISLMRGGHEVKHLVVRRELNPQGTRIDFDPVVVDAIEITPTRLAGLVERRHVAALAEVEAIARLLED
jgi:hypothetical protein